MENLGIKIAIIDDEPSVVESFKQILSIKNYQCDGFLDGQVFIDSFQKDAYDVAFIDMKMPAINGIDLLRKIKEKDINIEVIVVTAYATDATHANAISLGAMEYLRKPFLMEEIYELVDRAIKRRRAKGIKKGPAAPPPADIH